MEQTCKTCHYSVTDGARMGCARFPPTAHLVPAQGLAGPTIQAISVRPEVRPDDWCGEYTPKKAAYLRQIEAGLKLV